MSIDELMAAVKPALAKSVGKRGGAVVDANLELIRAAYEELIDVTAPLRSGVSTRVTESEELQEATV